MGPQLLPMDDDELKLPLASPCYCGKQGRIETFISRDCHGFRSER